ncbi:sensor histidine kinase, partial [Sphingomonas sp. RB1R13]|uniref:sensor histidine kinase n=1 Tax=Sphingomonas sp. RB1R13 TaxID=3096159 RepID=UPI002FC73521
REIVSQELSHRIKNIFAVISGLIAFAARSHPGFGGIASDLRDRITALGRAHDFVRPHSPQSQPKARQDSLHGLLGDLFEPYRGDEQMPRITVAGDDVPVDDRSATPLALLFHELATNAAKYGALTAPEGKVTVTWAVRRDGDKDALDLSWVERGGPPAVEPTRKGFGSRIIRMGLTGSGGVQLRYEAQGLSVQATAPLYQIQEA